MYGVALELEHGSARLSRLLATGEHRERPAVHALHVVHADRARAYLYSLGVKLPVLVFREAEVVVGGERSATVLRAVRDDPEPLPAGDADVEVALAVQGHRLGVEPAPVEVLGARCRCCHQQHSSPD